MRRFPWKPVHPILAPAFPRDRSAPGGVAFSPGAGSLSAPCLKELLQLGSKHARWSIGHEMSEGIMSHEFDGLDATEKAGIEGALNRCRAVAAQIASELRNKRPEHFVDKLSLADFYASLEHAADVLGQGQRSVENTPAPVVKGSQVPHRQL